MRELPLILACIASVEGALHLVASLEPPFAIGDHRVLDLDGRPGAEILALGRAGEVRTFRWSREPAGFDPKTADDFTIADPRRALVALEPLAKDGIADLFVAGPRGVEVHRASSTGAFGPDVVARADRARSRIRTGRPVFAPLGQDVDGDGLTDIVVPNGAKLEVWLQRPGTPAANSTSFLRAASVNVPISSQRDTDMDELSDSIESRFTLPALRLVDVNGDTKRDLLVDENQRRAFHLVQKDGTIPAEPTVAVDLSIFKDTTPEASVTPGRTLAGSDRTVFESRDLDLDGIPDYLIAHRRKVWIFHGTSSGPQFETPSSVLKAADDVTALLTLDLDDDKKPDLLLVRVQVPSVATILRGLVSEWEIQLTASGYRAGGERDFESTPAWKSELAFRVPAILSILRDPDALLKRFEDAGRKLRQPAEGDFDGDDQLDVALVSEDGLTLEVWRGDGKSERAAKETGEAVLRRVLFQEEQKSWDVERVIAFVAGFGEGRVRALTGGRPPDARFTLRDPAATTGPLSLANVTPADVDGDGHAEIVLRYDAPDGARSVFDVLGWTAK